MSRHIPSQHAGFEALSHADSSRRSNEKIDPALSGLSVDVADEIIAALADCSADLFILFFFYFFL